MTEERIAALEAKGFNRWTKGDYDRLYIHAEDLGLELTFYKSGNISSAKFNGEWISNSAGYRLLGAKTYVDVKTGKVYSTNSDLKEAAEKLIEMI